MKTNVDRQSIVYLILQGVLQKINLVSQSTYILIKHGFGQACYLNYLF